MLSRKYIYKECLEFFYFLVKNVYILKNVNKT